MMPVRIDSGIATIVFAVSAAFCALVTLLILEGGSFDPEPLNIGLIVMATFVGGLCGRVLLPRLENPTLWQSMFAGAGIALLSHIPFAILFAIFDAVASYNRTSLGEFFGAIAAVVMLGWIFAGVPQIVFGAAAGAVSRHLSRSQQDTRE